MISLNTLLFPDTDIFKDKLYPLFLFCKPVLYLQPIESDQNSKSETDSFMEKGLCQGLTPAPLGINRERFLHLVKDIRERKDDYAAQLSSLVMAAMSAPVSRKSGESRHEIISSLLRGHEVLTSETDDSEIELWQARLVLSIAEILDREEDELLQHLELLDERELEMFRSLQGEDRSDGDDIVAELTRIKKNSETPRPQEIKKRFKAWLLLMRNGVLPPISLWLATSRNSGDQIIIEYEKKNSIPAQPILKVPLPGPIMVSTGYLVKYIERFHHAAQTIHGAIVRDLEKLSKMETYTPGAPETLLPNGSDWLEKWEMVLDEHFPAHSHGRSALTLYLLPDTPMADLLALSVDKTSQSGIRHAILGIFDD